MHLGDHTAHYLLRLVETGSSRNLATLLLQGSLLDHSNVLLDPADPLLNKGDLLADVLRFLKGDLVAVLGHAVKLVGGQDLGLDKAALLFRQEIFSAFAFAGTDGARRANGQTLLRRQVNQHYVVLLPISTLLTRDACELVINLDVVRQVDLIDSRAIVQGDILAGAYRVIKIK